MEMVQQCGALLTVRFRDWSLITGRGGGLQNGSGGGGGGVREVLPLRKGGGGAQKVLAMLKGGGTTSFGVVFTR